MKALQLERPERWLTIEVPEPPTPGPGEALLRVDRVGVCGTDFGGFLGKMPFFSYPRIPGHELGVEVLAVGEGVTNVVPGDRCAVEPYLNCQQCYACRRGFTNCCEQNKTLGVMCDGGLAERIVLPARKLHLASRLSAEQCALVETLAIGCHAIDRSSAKSGEHVLIIGAGPIGLSALEFAKLSGAKPLVMDVSESRLAFVREKMGVPDTLLVCGDQGDVDALSSKTNGQLADVVIDATGNSHSMVRALEFASFAGRVVYVGITQQHLDLPHAPVLHRRELTLMASRNANSRDFPRIIQLIADGKINTEPWITHHAPMSEVPDIFPIWLKPETGVIKAMIDVN
ncbi:MAG TPA: zinc-binding alcohol dehydrogenase family protein [Chthoniobacteraceae bacterium]|nr:zinc-binding alcohol dehydrogenase family protein [Chthoniobacteraceae bacterium]